MATNGLGQVRDLYRTVYETVRQHATASSHVDEHHKEFASVLPSPDEVSEDDAAALCSLVVVSGSHGLEGFYGIREPKSGRSLGDLVREKLPSYSDHQERARELVEQLRPKS